VKGHTIFEWCHHGLKKKIKRRTSLVSIQLKQGNICIFKALLLLIKRVLLSTANPPRYRGRCWAAIRLSHRPEPSGRVVRGEVGALDIGGRHGRRFVLRLTHRPQRRPYPFVQAGAETSDNGAEVVDPDSGSSWEGHSGCVCVPVSGIKVWSLVGLSAHSTFYWWSVHSAAWMLLLSEKLMSCCAAGTNGCLDLRRCAAAPDGRVSAERRRCPGSMARRPRDSVAPLRRSSAGWVPARIGRLSAGVGRRHPVTIRKASLMVGSVRRVWALRHQTGAQYSAVEWTRDRVAIRNGIPPAPQPEPASRLRSTTCDVIFLRSDSRCRRYVSDLSNVTPR